MTTITNNKMKQPSYKQITIKALVVLLILFAATPIRAFSNLTLTISGQTTTCYTSDVSFTATATGAVGTVTYTWYKNDVQVTSVYSIAPNIVVIASVANGDEITCRAVDQGGNSGQSNMLTITVTGGQNFTVAPNPSSINLCQGQSVTFTAVGNMPLGSTFQWTMNGTVQSETGGTFSTIAQSEAQLQSVTVTANTTATECVINQTASGSAAGMLFIVNPPGYPSLSVTQNISPVPDGSPVTFTATPSGQGNFPQYQWVLNGNVVSDVTGPTYTTSITSGTDIQTISVSMTSTGTCPQNPAVATTSFQIVPSDWENQNYVRVQDILVSGISNFFQIDQLPIGQKRETTTYVDGLGREIQKLDKSGSLVGGTASDLVVPVSYDQAGRKTQQFLPYATNDNPGYFKSNNVPSEQATFVTNKFGEPSGAPTYSQTAFDNSPLNRVLSVYAPGTSWGGSNIGMNFTYDLNDVSENVHIWTLGYSAGAIPSTTATSFYNTGTLYKNTTTDENGKIMIVYVDLSGDTILRKVQVADVGANLSGQHAGWACTYYVYDDLHQLRFILTPKLIDYLDDNTWALTQQLVNDLAFVYNYDGKGRQISKKQPGIGEVDAIYDQRDRPVFMQDALGHANNQWQSVTYDELDRQTNTGMLSGNITPTSLQAYVNGNTGNITVNEDAGVQANLVVSGTQSGNSLYSAANSIIFDQFTSTGTLSTSIDPNLGPIVPEAVAIADNPAPGGYTLALLTQTFYDDYSQGTKTYSTADNSLFDVSTNQQALPLPSQYEPQTRGHVTVSKVKVIINPADLTQGNWLEDDVFYDNEGQVIQTQNDNSLGGTDVVTNRYDFAGKLWGSCIKHMAGSPTQFTVVSKNTYDNLGRLTDLSKNFNSTFFKDLATYSYDEYGKLITKVLAPGYTGSNKTSMETLNYNYNIQGWLTGINKDYALDQNTYDQWNDFFGLYLGYDNRDNQFNAAKYDGAITGAIWKSQGDNSMRRYDYSYDNMGRLTAAAFQQRATPADDWSNSQVDLSETVSYTDKNGNVDKNGNIQAMQRNGLVPGMNGGVQIDNLSYAYGTSVDPNSNQLMRVDEAASFAGNGQLNDFKDGTNAAGTVDYSYDVNGNLSQDQNKGITAIAYNYLNKPYSVTIAGKSIIAYTYDATGTKLSKTVTDLTVTPNVVTTTNYDDEFIYQNSALQYVLHEEGRLNIITPVSNAQQQLNAGSSGANLISGKQGVFEYFIKDQLSNVRMVLTEESQTENYIATMETSSSADPNLGTDEAKLFGQVDPTTGNPTADNEVTLTRKATNLTPWTGNTSAEVSDLTAASTPTNQTIGPNLILKVSAGDVINAAVNYFYYNNGPTGPNYTGNDVVTALLSSLAGSHLAPLAEGNSGLIGANMNTVGSDFNSFINTYVNSSTSSAPKAFLNVIFFDEQFNFIPPDPNAPMVGTGLSQVYSPNNQSAAPLVLGQKAPKNGWVYIYISNESNEDVYFDNLRVSQVHGNISEENHYYAFGQRIAGICSIAFNKLANPYRYQGDNAEEENNTQWNEFDLRMYDPQIGRWTGADPYDQFASPYVGMGNDPVNNTDPSGGDLQLGVSWGGIIGSSVGALAGSGLYLIAHNNGWNGYWSAVAGIGGALAGSGLGYATGQELDPPVGGYAGNFGNTLVAFYKGLFGDVSENDVKLRLFGSETSNTINSGAVIPNIWGGLNFNFNFFGIFKQPIIDEDILREGEDILIDVVFQKNQANIDFNRTNKEKLDLTVNKIVKTLKKDKKASLELSGGTNESLSKGVDIESNTYTYAQLVRDRVQAVKNYINQFTKERKILRRINDSGNVIRTGPVVKGKIVH